MPNQTAKLFNNGRSQAVRLPAEFRFAGTEVYIRKEGEQVILSPRPDILGRLLRQLATGDRGLRG